MWIGKWTLDPIAGASRSIEGTGGEEDQNRKGKTPTATPPSSRLGAEDPQHGVSPIFLKVQQCYVCLFSIYGKYIHVLFFFSTGEYGSIIKQELLSCCKKNKNCSAKQH